MRRITGAVSLAAAILLAAAGCSSVVVRSYPGTPSGAPTEPRASVAWIDDGKRIAITTLGSSSCPNAPDTLTVKGDTSLVVTLKQTGGPACTADSGGTTFEVNRPDGLDTTREIRVTMGEQTYPLAPLRP